ncbi:MAG: hypothetical protein ABI369_06075 [Acetobacteraceae bacterium]
MLLRPERARVTRLSRKVLIGLGVIAATGISAALFFALQPNRQTGGSELYNTDNRSTPDGLANLPRDYTGLRKMVPQLGPALPGDLGRPIVNVGAPAPACPRRPCPIPRRDGLCRPTGRSRQSSHLRRLQWRS